MLVVESFNVGYVLGEANGQVVYTFSGDKKGKPGTFSGAGWKPVTGKPVASAADNIPGTLGSAAGMNGGAAQITYNGLPLYTFEADKSFQTKGASSAWRVIKLSKSDVIGA